MNRTEELLRRMLERRGANVRERPQAEPEFLARLPRRRSRRSTLLGRGLAIAAVAAAVVLVVLIPTLLPVGGSNEPADSSRPSEHALAPSDVRSRTTLPFTPAAISAGQGAAWAVDGRGHLARIDGVTGAVSPVVQLPAGVGAHAPVAGFGTVWLADPGGDAVLGLDPQTGAVLIGVPVSSAGPVSVGLLGVWAQTGPRELGRIDPASGRITERLSLPITPEFLLDAHGALWAAGGAQLVRIDPHTHDVRTLSLDGQVRSLTATAGATWAATEDGLTRVTPAGTARTTRPLRVDGDASADHAGHTVYVAAYDGALAAVDDSRAPLRVRVVRVADEPLVGPAVGLGSVWVGHGTELLRLVTSSL